MADGSTDKFEPHRNGFEQEAVEVLTGLKDSFKGVIASLGVRRAVDLRRALQLQGTLSWQIFKLASERNVLAAGSAVPPRGSVARFAEAAAKVGVPADRVRSVMAAYDRFDLLVQRHAGDRTSFNSLVAATTGLTEEWLAADQQHRRNVFRGLSHLLGVQAKTRLMCDILTRAADGGVDVASVTGYVGLRMLRPRDRFRVFGLHLIKGKFGDKSAPECGPLGLGQGLGGYCIDEFCSQPLPRMVMSAGRPPESRWVEASLVRPDVGNLGVADVFFGATYHTDVQRSMTAVVTTPIEALVMDVLVEPGVLEGAPKPTLEVFFGNENPEVLSPDYTPIEGRFEVERLGDGPAAMETSDVPRYADLLAAAGRHTGRDLSKLEAWRVHLDYPVHRSVARLWLTPSRHAAK